jgi:epoxyqueuosine reductase
MQEKISKDPLKILADKAGDFTQLAESIKAWGNELGFQDISIADAGTEMTPAESGLQEWLSKGYHGEMDYMAKHGTRHTRPAELTPGTLRVISPRINYMPPARDSRQVVTMAIVHLFPDMRWDEATKRCSADACKSLPIIPVETRHFNYRVFTDSAPVMEVEWAQKSGLGWRGKYTLLLSCEAGSMFFLGELYTDLPLPIDNAVGNYCGSCTMCIDICPTQAIIAPYRLEPRAAFLISPSNTKAVFLSRCVL